MKILIFSCNLSDTGWPLPKLLKFEIQLWEPERLKEFKQLLQRRSQLNIKIQQVTIDVTACFSNLKSINISKPTMTMLTFFWRHYKTPKPYNDDVNFVSKFHGLTTIEERPPGCIERRLLYMGLLKLVVKILCVPNTSSW